MDKLLSILYLWLLLIIEYLVAQNLRKTCESSSAGSSGGTPSITISLKEASLGDLNSNPDGYIADTKINGILGSTDTNQGIRFTLSSTSATPGSIDLDQQFSFESKTLPSLENGFSQRAFIRLIKPLDRDGSTPTTFDDLNVVEFQLKCQRVGSTQSIFYVMKVDVQDINDNSPIFSGTPYQASVNELTPVGTTVFREVAAADLDAGYNKNIDFTVVAGNGGILDGSQKFSIPTPRLGYVVTSSFLDFEALNAIGQTYYILNIPATDQSLVVSDRKTSYTQLRIDITDGDDLPPAFEMTNCFRIDGVCFHPSYTTQLYSNSTIGVLPLHPRNSPTTTESLAAKDRDTLNSSIQFTVEETIPSGYENRFSVTGTGHKGKLYTATLSQTQPIERNLIEDLEIIIKAMEISDNRRYERAVIKAMTESPEIFSNSSCPNSGLLSVSIQHSLYNVSTGSDVTLVCTVTSVPMHTSVYWIKIVNNMQTVIDVTNNNKYSGSSVNKPSLTIRNVDNSDQGNYTCYASNSIETGQSQTTLQIFVNIPTVRIPKASYSVVIGSSVVLECIVTSDHLHDRVQWQKLIKNQYQNITFTNTKYEGSLPSTPSLTIKNADMNDDGNYRCTATNSVGTGQSSQTFLHVTEKTEERVCGNAAALVGAILGTLLAIVIGIFLGYIIKTRRDNAAMKSKTQRNDARSYEYQNNGVSLDEVLPSQPQRNYEDMGERSPRNVYDDLQGQYDEPILTTEEAAYTVLQ